MKKISSLPWILFLFLLWVGCREGSAELGDTDIKQIIAGDTHNSEKELEKVGTFAARSDAGSNRRRRLPAGNIFSRATISILQCGGSYDISSDGYKFWKMNSRSKNCYHAFLGSRFSSCRVGIMCDGIINMEEPSSPFAGCDQEYLRITDGTIGSMIGCGRFTFKNQPRFSRNNGTDLYVYYKGTAENPCVAMCIEDLDESHDVRKPKQITQNKEFQGFQLHESCSCGKRRDFARVVGGEEALMFEFPWIAAVTFAGASWRHRLPFCGATLVNDRYLVSAAHCFSHPQILAHEIQIVLHAHVMDRKYRSSLPRDDPKYEEIPGWDLSDETDETEDSIRADVEEIINHPLFNINNYDWDVAIIKLKQRINFGNNKVAPICLPLIGENLDYKKGETKFVVAGWGLHQENAITSSRILMKLDVPYVDHQKCDRHTWPMNRHICAGFTSGGLDACRGDSGGPLIYKFSPLENQYLLSGVVSAGEGCGRKGKVGLYTNTLEVIQWIYHQTSDGIFCKR